MKTEIFAWNSYSCNNSSDYRLVVDFRSSQAAEAVRDELQKFFLAHAKEHDRQAAKPGFDWPGEPTKVARELGAKYGHTWKEFLVWGDDGLAGDEPEVAVVGSSVVLYHDYSSGGFGPDVPRVLERAGGKLVEKGAKGGPPILYGSFDATKGAKWVTSLAAVLDQRHGGKVNLSDWTWPKWMAGGGKGDVDDVSLVVESGRCTFTMPISGQGIVSLRAHLAAAPDLELRLATKADVTANKKREERLAAKQGGVPALLVQTTAAKATRRGPVAVTTMFDFQEKLAGADDVIAGDDIVALAGGAGKTQRFVVRGTSFAATKLSNPKMWLQGVLVEADGTWRAGGENSTIFASNDLGKTWKEERHPGLADALGSKRIWCVLRFQGDLWASGEGGVARQVGGAWQPVALPSAVKSKWTSSYPHRYLPRLVVLSETLYVLEQGIARWSGKKLEVELAQGHDVRALGITSEGTLLAAGEPTYDPKARAKHRLVVTTSRNVWRKPRGGTWTLVSEKAIDVPPKSSSDDPKYDEAFVEILSVDGALLLVGQKESPTRQQSAVRLSEDDGKTFRRLPVKVKGGPYGLIITRAIDDGRGGALLAGEGGALLRVSRDGLGSWASGSSPGKVAKAAAGPAKAAASPAKASSAKSTASPAKATAKGAASGSSAERRFEFVGGGSSKFWAISRAGVVVTTRFGRIGTDGLSSAKSFADEEKAKKEFDKLVAEKTKKGYVEA